MAVSLNIPHSPGLLRPNSPQPLHLGTDPPSAAAGLRSALLSAAAHTVMSLAVKLVLDRDADLTENASPPLLAIPRTAQWLALVRSGSSLVLVYAYLHSPHSPLPRAQRTLIPSNARTLLLFRALLGGTANLAHFAAVSSLDIGIATVLGGLGPAVAGLAGWIVLGERPGLWDSVGMVLAFIGVWLVSHLSFPWSGANGGQQGSAVALLGLFFAILSAGSKSLGAVLVRWLSMGGNAGNRVHPIHLVASYSIGTTALGLLSVIALPTVDDKQRDYLDLKDSLYVALLIAGGFGAQMWHVFSLVQLPAHRVLLVATMQAIMGFAAQILIWGHWPDLQTIVGGLAIVVGVAFSGSAVHGKSEETVPLSPDSARKAVERPGLGEAVVLIVPLRED